MRKTTVPRRDLRLALVLVTICTVSCRHESAVEPGDANGFLSNEAFINELYHDLDTEDAMEVFRFVFSRLDDEVTVYPTENYYYFQFYARGKWYLGTICLPAHSRDQGVLEFSYVERVDKFRQHKRPDRGGGADWTATDGVHVDKLSDFKYAVTFEDRTVQFRLNDVGLDPPRKARLLPDEEYVGPSFDESGLKFFLLFNRSTSHLYWILNEDGFVPEHFTPYSDDVVIGDRTEFAFYLDRENHRKILVAVHGLNVMQNNWYDGPFDQMPDNFVYTGQIDVKPYLEASYPEYRGRIDRYGRYLDDPGSRIAVANCFVYFSKKELDFVDRYKKTAQSKSEFYTLITQQIFHVPKDLGDEIR